jgi:hypothetical protein
MRGSHPNPGGVGGSHAVDVCHCEMLPSANGSPMSSHDDAFVHQWANEVIKEICRRDADLSVVVIDQYLEAVLVEIESSQRAYHLDRLLDGVRRRRRHSRTKD